MTGAVGAAHGIVVRSDADGLSLRVRATPKADRDRVAGWVETPDGPALAVRVRAAPEAGKANDAIARTLADWLEVPKSCAEVVAGATSRLKIVAVVGDSAALTARIARKLTE